MRDRAPEFVQWTVRCLKPQVVAACTVAASTVFERCLFVQLAHVALHYARVVRSITFREAEGKLGNCAIC